MSAEYRNLINHLARRIATVAGTVALGDAFEQNGYSQEDGEPIDAEGFLEMHRRDVRVMLAELRVMGKLK